MSSAVAVQLAAGCSSAAPASAMSAAELTQRQLTSKTVPTGFEINIIPQDPTAAADSGSASPQATPLGRVPCDALEDALEIVDTYEPPASRNTKEIMLSTTGLNGLRWLGSERLVSYPGDGAAHVLTDIRELGARCAKTNIGEADTPTYATVVDGPKLGDESVMVKVRSTLTTDFTSAHFSVDAMLIRIGSALIVLDETSTPTPADGSSPQLAALASVAVTAFNAAGN
ncbi:hypothetical protein [Actinospica robiniae]|uniref:hypothetical protein n=1 Tax=Actinospica robiniae TaxID=304901 RepID=UPI0012F89470|nr:hypothetical protein [Actinospica robiniae]